MTILFVILAVAAILVLAPLLFTWGLLALAVHYGEKELRSNGWQTERLADDVLANRLRRRL